MLTKEQIESIASGCSTEIQGALKERVTKLVVDAAGWELEQAVRKQVSEYIQAEVAPEVAKFLTENKDGLVKAACAGAAQVGELLQNAIIEDFSKKLKSDWDRKRMIEAIFKS